MGISKRERKCAISCSFSFFCWWVMLRPSPASPRPYPLMVWARITVGRPVVSTRRLVGVIDLARIVPAAAQLEQLVVAQVRYQIEQLGVLAEEVLADVGAVPGDVGLHLAVHHFAHALLEQAGGVARQQRVPIAAPDHLDHVPAVAAESGFQLLDHLAVAAHRAVEALEVAVDDEDEVVELLARGQRERPHGFRLVHFAIAQKGPDLAGVGGMRPRFSR